MSYVAKRRFPANGVVYDEGDPVPAEYWPSKNTLLSAGYISYEEEEVAKPGTEFKTHEQKEQGIREYTEASKGARRIARENGIDINEVEGTGLEGRVLVPDVRRAAGIEE
jgi:pyruvate/2-oxoglutarate dehydrogenase complex dihydrolipoamide acyltransferase (E2) component